jgi:diaminopimelate decarboxylase
MQNHEKHDYEKLAASYGSPFYLYDMDEAGRHAEKLKSLLPAGVDVLYCMKANANPRVLRAFKPHVFGIDISSGGELELALAAGYSPQVMSFAGPGKTDAELARSVEVGLHLLSVESFGELRRLRTIAQKAGKRVRIALRINPLATAKAFNMRMGGLPSQFGIGEEEAEEAMREALSYRDVLDVAAVHVFSGTQCLDTDAIVENIEQTVAIADRLSGAFDHRLEVVNLGGGFGIPYFQGQEAMDLDALGAGVSRALSRAREDRPRLRDTRFVLELGRYLIGMFGIYVARVVDTKETRGKRFAILDGGMNHCFPATGNFGQLVKKNYPVKNLSKPAGEAVAQEICGPLCTPMDQLGRAIEVPRCDVGDLVGFLNCGAYAYSASPLLFLGHHTPIELVYENGAYEIGRSRHPVSDFS